MRIHSAHLPSAGRSTVALVTVLSLLHLLVMGRVDLSVDEAHYALYGLWPDWSYFDHPPMVGWLQALVLPLSQHEFALRLWPLLLGAAASLLLYRLSRELFPEESPWLAAIAVVILQSAVIFQLLSIALVPELPLLLFALAAMLFLQRAVTAGRWRDWLLLGLCFGLAGLSKYTAVTLVVTAITFILWQRQGRIIFTPRPWVAVVVALLVISPVLYWNATHDWLSFAYQLGHGMPQRHWDATRFARTQAGQLLAYAPGIYLFGLAALVATRRELNHPGVRLLIALALPLMLLFGWSSGLEETLPHWTLLAWAALAPLTARWLLQHWQRRGTRYLAYSSLAYSGLLTLVIHSQFAWGWLPFAPYQHPLRDLYGWREAAQHGLALRQGEGERLMVGNWTLASRIGWYARPAAVIVTDSRFDQFDLWYGSPQPGEGGLLIVPDYYEGRARFSGLAHFDQCQLVDELQVPLHGTAIHRFTYYRCNGYHG